MTITKAKDVLTADFQAKKADGLRDLKFFIGNVSGKTVEDVCADVNSVFAAVKDSNFIVQKTGDFHRQKVAGQ